MSNEELICEVTTFKLLGVQINAKPSWFSNTEHIIRKASKASFLLHRFEAFGATADVASKLYNSFILMTLEYASAM